MSVLFYFKGLVQSQFWLVRFLRTVSVLLGLAITVMATQASAQAADPKKVPEPQAFGAWSKVCTLPPGTPNIQCEIVQNVRAQDRPDITFRITFLKLPQNKMTLMRVFVPIRVELPLGVGIKVDDKDMGKMPYRRCLGDTCVAEVLLQETEINAFLNGKSATYFIYTTPEESVGGVIDLTGLKAGYNALSAE